MTTAKDNVMTAEGLSLADAAGAAELVRREAPAWLGAVRDQAAARFAELGLPTTTHEDWRFINLDPLRQAAFARGSDVEVEVAAADVERLGVPGLEAHTLVFVNGVWREDLSVIGALPEGVVVARLADAVETHRDLVEAHLARHLSFETDVFAALNTAAMEDGVFVYVPRGVALATPVHVLAIAGGGPAFATHPRNLIVVEDEAAATVIEDYVAFDDEAVYLTNAATEIVVGANADVHHYLLERESPAAFNVSTLRIVQARESRFASHSALFGGSIVRNNVLPTLDGDDAWSLLNGLYVGRGSQHFDNFMRVEHRRLRGDSRQFYKGILNDRARGVFSGRIVVAKGAQKTDAKQSNQNLLLSEDARVNTKPQLEIYADDVKCTHGATVGQMDSEALFYLQARGLSRAQAQGLLIHAFAAESLDRMEIEPIRAMLDRMLLSRLPGGDAVDELLGKTLGEELDEAL